MTDLEMVLTMIAYGLSMYAWGGLQMYFHLKDSHKEAEGK